MSKQPTYLELKKIAESLNNYSEKINAIANRQIYKGQFVLFEDLQSLRVDLAELYALIKILKEKTYAEGKNNIING